MALERFFSRIDRVTGFVQAPAARRAVIIAASIAFAGGLLLSIRALPPEVELRSPLFLLQIGLIGVPLRALLSILELRVSASLVGGRIAWARATRTSLIASAANMLPLPGGPLVRVAALKSAGGTLARSGAITALAGMLWLGLAFVFAGAALLPQPAYAPAFLVVGAIGLTAGWVGLHRASGSLGLPANLVLIKAAGIAIGLMRLHWAFLALGIHLSVERLAVFSVSSVVGSATAVVPAGLGIIEIAAASLAPLAGVASPTAFLATALNRLVGLPVMLLITLGVLFFMPSGNADEK